MQFSSHSIEQILKHFLNYSASRRKSLLYFFPGAFNIKLVNSFILVWHSDYELSSKTHKPLFIIKESSKYHNIDYRAKNHVVLFCLVCNRSRASSTRTRPTSTQKLLNLSREKIKMLFTGLGRSVLRPWAVLKTSGTVFPNTDLPAGE